MEGKTGPSRIIQILDTTLQCNGFLHMCKWKPKDIQIRTSLSYMLDEVNVMYKYMTFHKYVKINCILIMMYYVSKNAPFPPHLQI